MRLLLVEDDPMVQQALLPILSETGLSITTASSLSEARRYWHNGTFDLVITDRNLGNDSILPFLDELASAGSKIPVLLMTAEPTDHPAVQKTLVKPFSLVAFQRFLDEGLQAMPAIRVAPKGFVT